MEVISVEEFGDLYGGTTDGLSEDFAGLHVGRDDFGHPTYYGAFDRGLVRQGPHLVYHDTGGLAQSAHWVDGYIVGPLLQWSNSDRDMMFETDFGSSGAKTNTHTVKIFAKDELSTITVYSGFECVATYLVKDKIVDLEFELGIYDSGEVYLIEGEAIDQISQAKRIR